MPADPLFTIGLSCAAFMTAALSGIAGLGGGSILIGLFYAIGLAPVEAIPLFAAVQFASNLSRTVAYVRHVEWHATGWFLLTAVPATFLLAPYVEHVNVDWIKLLLAALILFSLRPGHADKPPLPERASFMLAGLLNGSLGLLVGATGLVVGRFYLRPDWRRETTLGTMALTQGLGHLLRVLAYGFAGFSALGRPGLLIPLCLAVIAGTTAGRQINRRLDEEKFALLFRTLLIVMSLKLIWDGARGLVAP